MVARSTSGPGAQNAGQVEQWIPLALGLSFIAVAFIIAFYPSIQLLIDEWASARGAFSHGYLIAAVSAYLVVRAVPKLANIDHRSEWPFLVVLLLLSLAWLLAHVATVKVVETSVLPLLLLAAVGAAYGLQAARFLAFPILFLYFAMPVWDFLNFIFQAATVIAVGVLIRLADIPALLDGNLVTLSSGGFDIAGGCSGLNFVLSGLSLAALYGYLFYTRLSLRLALLLLMFSVAVIGNWVRVFAIIFIGYQTEMQSSIIHDHGLFGWVLFGLLLVPVFFVARRMEDIDAGIERVQSDSNRPAGFKGGFIHVGLAIAVMAAGPVWALTIKPGDVMSAGLQVNMPQAADQWVGPADTQWNWSPDFVGAATERVAEYNRQDSIVLAYGNIFISQSHNAELIRLDNSVAGNWDDRRAAGRIARGIETDGGVRFRQVLARNYLGAWLIWYRYQIETEFEVSPSKAKFMQAMKALQGKPEAGIIAFASPCASTCDNAAAALEDFVGNVGYLVRLDFNREIK